MTSAHNHPTDNRSEGDRMAELRHILEALFEERAEPAVLAA